MIYEVRTYDLKVGSLPEVENRFEAALPHRLKYSPLAGFFHTDIGPLNQIIHIWAYESAEERVRVRAEAAKDPNWPPAVGEFLTNMKSEIMIPFDHSPELKPGNLGPVYEMRYYTFRPGSVPRIAKAWAEWLPNRIKLSPLVCCWYSEHGLLNQLVHVWAYKNFQERFDIRKKAVETGVWPPPGGHEFLVTMANKIMLPASFSPLQ